MPGEQSEREPMRPSAPASDIHPDTVNTTLTNDGASKEAPQATLTREPSAPIISGARRSNTGKFWGLSKSLNQASRAQRTVFIAIGMVLILLTLLLLLSDMSRSAGLSGIAKQHPPTATPLPTATTTTIPTPTVLPGFQLFIDTTDGFMLQYPAGWSKRLNNPGAEFTDDAVNTTFEMQVLLPSDTAAVGLTGDPSNATSWVNFAMQSFATQYAGEFQQDAGPLPAATFAGVTWQTARGLISDQVHIRVQVYATVYQGRPYMISLYASDDAFSIADMVYFQPMQQSFQFLPATS